MQLREKQGARGYPCTAQGFIRMACGGLFCIVALISSESCSEGVKNIILMIGDGWGFNHLESTDYFQHGEKGKQVFEKEFLALAVSTYPAEGSYDPALAWSDFDYVKTGTTDSAAAATALATGYKTKNGKIGLNPEDHFLENLVEKAEKQHKSTGVVTTVQFSHATPAAFGAHNTSRGNYEEIAQDMFVRSGLDVIMGACHPWFDKAGHMLAEANGADLPEEIPEKNYRYVGGASVWHELLSGRYGGDADGDEQADPWTIVQTRAEFQKLLEGDTPKRVLGVAQIESTLQFYRDSSIGDIAAETPGQSPRIETVPTLAEMMMGALNVLDNDPDGFFLMVEGGAIDWASRKSTGRTIEETMDYISAIESAVAWVNTNSNWEETLMVITADHETGYPNGPGSDPEWKPIQNNGQGKLPGLEWYGGHTRSLVPLFVKGKGSEEFSKAAMKEDPKRGNYLDNTDIGRILGEFLSQSGFVSGCMGKITP